MTDAKSFFVRPPSYLVTPNLRPTSYAQKRVTRRKVKVENMSLGSQIRTVEKITTNPTAVLLDMKTGKFRWTAFGILTTAFVVGFIIYIMLYRIPWLNDENLSKDDSEYPVILAVTIYTLVVLVYRMIVKLLVLKAGTLPMDVMLTLITVGFAITRLTWLLDPEMSYDDPRRMVFVVESWISVIALSIIAFMILVLGFVIKGDVSRVKLI